MKNFKNIPYVKFSIPNDISVETYLRKKKFRSYSTGAYAHVYTHAKYPDKVLKVLQDDSDDAYIDYLKFCSENQDSPFVPKIHAIYIIQSDFYCYNEQYYAIVLEKLKHKRTKSFSNALDGLMGELINLAEIVSKENIPDSIFSFSLNLMDFIHRKNLEIDIHDENVMYRGDIPVITDPVM